MNWIKINRWKLLAVFFISLGIIILLIIGTMMGLFLSELLEQVNSAEGTTLFSNADGVFDKSIMWAAFAAIATIIAATSTAILGVVATVQGISSSRKASQSQQRLLEIESNREKDKLFEEYKNLIEETDKIFESSFVLNSSGFFRKTSEMQILLSTHTNNFHKKLRVLRLKDPENSNNKYFVYLNEKIDEMGKIFLTYLNDQNDERITQEVVDFINKNNMDRLQKGNDFSAEIHSKIFNVDSIEE